MANLILKEISMRYERKYILDTLNLEINHGELVVLLGESGCGKTTLLKIVAGIIESEKGKVIVDNEDITDKPPQKRKIGYVPQAQVLFPHMKVKENIKFGLEAHKYSKEEIEKKILWVSELTQIKDLLDRYPSEISGGQKQRVALARAVVIEPKILLLDEPLSSIDATGRESLALTIRRIQTETETTTLYVTHNQEEARLISDRVGVIYDGRIQQIGKVIEIDNKPKNYLIAKIMGTTNIWSVLYQEKREKRTILTTDIGKINLKAKLERKVTGIKIDPSDFEISFGLTKEEKENVADYLDLEGTVKSIIQKEKDVIRIVVELNVEPIEYVKVDVKKTFLDKTIKPNQEIFLRINPKVVQLL